MSKKVFNLVGYSDSSDEEQDGDSEKHMAICGVPRMQSETEKQKSDLESSGRKVAIVEPTVIEQNLDITHSSPPSPLPPPPPPSPETFLDADTLAQDEMENVAHILLDFSVSGVIGSNQEEQNTTQDSPVLITTSPVSDVVSENEVINISSDSDTIPYVVSANSPDNRITIDDCFSIKSVTSGEIVINTRQTKLLEFESKSSSE